MKTTDGMDDKVGVYIWHRLDGCLFNLRLLQAHIKTREWVNRDRLFTYDAALVAHTEQDLQCIVSYIADASPLFGLEVSLGKFVILHQPVPQEEY